MNKNNNPHFRPCPLPAYRPYGMPFLGSLEYILEEKRRAQAYAEEKANEYRWKAAEYEAQAKGW